MDLEREDTPRNVKDTSTFQYELYIKVSGTFVEVSDKIT